MSGRDVIQEVLTSPKTAHLTATLTAGTGIGTVLDMIPDDIGKLATLIGIVLSLVLIRNHWRNGRAKYISIELENQIMRQKIAEREEVAKLRKEAGLPIRKDER